MGNRAKIKGPEKKVYVDLQFMNWLAQFCAMIMPRKLRLVAGRGSAKTTEIQVERLIEMVYDMPGAPVAWVADTFANLTANVLPMVFEALERKGFRDGVHYVVEKQPPTFTEKECADLPKWLKPYFWKPYNKIISYKRTIVFFTGLNITFGSLDRPASLAGRSYVHVFGDEVKYFAEAKIGNLLKARRGYRLQFGHSPFYLGETFTTDMPNTGNTGEYDWIFKGAKEMDPETLLLVWKTASIANDAVQEYIAAKEKFYRTQADADRQEYLNKYKTANRWMERWYNLRHHEKAQSMFLIVSSYVNVDILSPQWFADALASQLSDVNAAILSMPPRIEKGQQFYPNLGERHFYTDGNIAAVEKALGFHDTEDCRLLRHLNPNRAIDMSMDFGNMLSMLIAQDDGRVLRGLIGADILQNALAAGGVKPGGRLVEDEDLRAADQRLEDLDLLLHADRDVHDLGLRLDVQVVFFRVFLRDGDGLRVVNEKTLARRHAEHHVFRHGQARHEHEVLVHHADPVGDGDGRGGERQLFAVHPDLAARRLLQTEQHLHQRGLAGAIAADHGYKVAVIQGEVDAGERALLGDGALVKGLLDVRELKHLPHPPSCRSCGAYSAPKPRARTGPRRRSRRRATSCRWRPCPTAARWRG